MHRLSKLENCAREILELVAIFVCSCSFLGPPADILSFQLVSRTIWNSISLKYNPHLYSRIYALKFDIRAPIRRLGHDCTHVQELANELVNRFVTLKRIKFHESSYPRFMASGYDGGFLRADLWKAYLMFIESDGKNARQLTHYANVGRLALDFVKPGGRLHDGIGANGSWTVDNEVNALVAWLFWFTDKDRVRSETPTERENILQGFAHFFIGSFKYASTHAPVTSFFIPPVSPPLVPTRTAALPLAASPLAPPCTIPDHFDFELTLARPLLVPAALLSCVVRLEAASAEITSPFPPDVPATRADAIALGWQGPTIEDYEQHQQVITKCVEWSTTDETGDGLGGTPSEMHEHDWMRLLTCYDPWSYPAQRDRVFTPGMLDGLWVGRWFGIPIDDFSAILSPEQAGQPSVTPTPPLVFPVPMQFRIREHHQYDPNDTVDFDDLSSDGRGNGVFNGWLPEGTVMAETDGELQVNVPNTLTPSTYRTYDPSAAAQAALDQELGIDREHLGPYGGGVWDIILTAETDEAFAAAWGYKRYHGRVRDWDGLVVLVRESADQEGRWIFRGYIHGKQNLIGRWRETATPIELPGWEGVWSMTKV